MPDWLFEGSVSVYLFLGVLALIFLGMWVRDRRRGWFLPLGIALLLMLAYFGLDRVVETSYEQITRNLEEMKAGVKAKNAERIFAHISDKFQFHGLDKKGFRGYVERVMERGGVTELEIWNVQRPTPSGEVTFNAKPKGYLTGTDVPYLIRAQFVKEGKGQWKLVSFQIFNPFVDTDKPITIPALPR